MYKIQNMFDNTVSKFVPCLHCKEHFEEYSLQNGYCANCAKLESGKLCDFCYEPILNGDYTQKIAVYDNPFTDKPIIKTVHVSDTWEQDCASLMFDSSQTDFHYFTCDECGRNVIVRCPSNGWHSYYRYTNGGNSVVCLRCYEQDLLDNGMSLEEFRNNTINGAFFNRDELKQYGYKELSTHFIGDTQDAAKLCKIAIEKTLAGNKVIINFERLAIGGLEGTVSLYVKEAE